MQEQVNQCAQTLRELVATAEQTKDGQIPSDTLRDYCYKLIEHWKIIRPDVIAKIQFLENCPDISAQFHPTIAQAILNLLNNAADASPENIEINIRWDTQRLYWTIKDCGAGIADEVTAHLGKSFISTKTKGMGIGLLLTQATINRYGGTVSLHNRNPHGTITQLELPIIFAS